MARSSRSQGPALTIYTGSLDAKIKAELQEIAASLGLAEDGKKADIIARIQGYLQRHPRTRENPSYTGIRLDYSNSTKPRHAASRYCSRFPNIHTPLLCSFSNADLPAEKITPRTRINRYQRNTRSHPSHGPAVRLPHWQEKMTRMF